MRLIQMIKTKKNYLYSQKYENFIKREEKHIKDENNKNRKEKEKYNYKFEDIDKFANEYDEKLENKLDIKEKELKSSKDKIRIRIGKGKEKKLGKL